MQQTQMQGTQTVAVVICTYCASDVIEACLDSLAATTGARLHVAVCDNASPDDTVAVVTDWALRHGVTMGHAHAGDSSVGDIGTKDALPWLTLVQAPSNLGFAGGVNAGLTWFLSRPEIDLFWVLNPDSLVRPDTAAAYVARANAVGAFGLMGGRTQFVEAPGLIQSDGGRVRHWTGGRLGLSPWQSAFGDLPRCGGVSPWGHCDWIIGVGPACVCFCQLLYLSQPDAVCGPVCLG